LKQNYIHYQCFFLCDYGQDISVGYLLIMSMR